MPIRPLTAHRVFPLAASLAACAGAAPPSSPTPAPSSTPAAPRAEGAPLGLLDPAPPEPPPPTPARPTPHPGAFVPVSLPPGTGAVLGVTGRATDDVWMIAAGNTVLHWDGHKAQPETPPSCHADTCCGYLVDCRAQPKRCAPGCEKRNDCAPTIDFDHIEVDRGDIRLGVYIYTGGITGIWAFARRGKDGRWACEQPGNDGLIPTVTTQVAPSVRLEVPNHALGGRQGETNVVVAERRLPLPPGVAHGALGMAARGEGDLWLWETQEPGRLWHGNGLGWTPIDAGLSAAVEGWLDGGAFFLLGDGPQGNVLLRRDLDRDTWSSFAAPGAHTVLRGGGRTWLLGNAGYYRWSGAGLARLDTPIALEDPGNHVWLGAAGDLWVVGGDEKTMIKVAGQDVATGLAVRLPAEGKP